MTKKARQAVIAGAGYAGLAVAAALGRRGWSVRVHERANSLRAFGAGIFLWENGLRVLRAIDAYDRVMTAAHEAPKFVVCDATGRRLSEYAFGPSMGTRMLTMTRQTLYEALLEAALSAGVKFVTGSEIIAARPWGALISARGEVFAGNLVIGADGVNSRVRESLGLTASKTNLPDGAIRVLIPRTTEEAASAEAKDVITYLSDVGRRVLYAPCDRSHLYVAFMSKAKDLADIAIPLNKKHWIRIYPHLARLIERIGAEGRWDNYQVIRSKRWFVGRAAILGDACHGLPPALGQGAGLGLANALSLAVNLEQNYDLDLSLKRWEETERPLTDHTQDCSLALLETPGRFSARGTNPWSDDVLRTARHVPVGTTP